MNSESPLFILAGNGSYENRGCEAIVRGTVQILRQSFASPEFIVLSFYRSKSQFIQQTNREVDPVIVHKRALQASRRFEPLWFLNNSVRLVFPPLTKFIVYKQMLPFLRNSKAVLSIGGDNYSLDYGVPKLFTELDKLAMTKKKPIIIWGASVGPFGAKPEYEKVIIEHLKRVNGIFARESETVEYLASKGLTQNVYRVADPAFLMPPTEPSCYMFDEELLKGAIGINLSPIMANFVTDGDVGKWKEFCSDFLKTVLDEFKRPICLIPHVTLQHGDDYEFMNEVLSMFNVGNGYAQIIPPGLTASETKWLISKMSVFIGCRTHSTIAALSSGIPTLSFAYSIKARGINRDVYGDESFCISPKISSIGTIIERISELLSNSNDIKRQICQSLPRINKLAMDSGEHLKRLLGEL